jgi:signal transduction histidine kinase
MPMNTIDTIDTTEGLITSTCNLEELLFKVAPLAAIGDLAATVAHEINNPVFGIINFLELAKDELPKDYQVQEYLNEALNQAERISQLVGDLMSVARSNTGVPEVFQPNEAVKAAVALYQKRLIKQHIEVHQNYVETVPMIFGVRGGFMAMIIDVLDNARCSMESTGKGLLVLESSVMENGWFQLKIEDHGIGFTRMDLAELLQPFVSKWESPSLGLGLCRVQKWLDSMQGKIHLDNCLEHHGTVVLLQFPPYQPKNQTII